MPTVTDAAAAAGVGARWCSCLRFHAVARAGTPPRQSSGVPASEARDRAQGPPRPTRRSRSCAPRAQRGPVPAAAIARRSACPARRVYHLLAVMRSAASSCTCPRSAATGSASRRSSSARRTAGSSRSQRRPPGRSRRLVDRPARARTSPCCTDATCSTSSRSARRPSVARHRRGRAAARAPHGERPGDARRAAAGAGARAVPGPGAFVDRHGTARGRCRRCAGARRRPPHG